MNFIQKLTRGADKPGALMVNNHATAFRADLDAAFADAHDATARHGSKFRAPLIGANLDRMRDDAGKAVKVLEDTDTLLRSEILRLNGELANTGVALEAARAKFGILNQTAPSNPVPTDAEVAAALVEGLDDFKPDEPAFPFRRAFPFRDMSTEPPKGESLLRPVSSAPVPMTAAEREKLIPKSFA